MQPPTTSNSSHLPLLRLLRSRWLWFGLALALFIGVVWNVDWTAVWEALRQLRLWQIGVLVLANLGVLGCLYGRWWLILRSLEQPVPFRQVAQIALVGYAVSYFTPGPHFGGEPLQALLLRRLRGVSLPTASASLVLDRAIMLLINFSVLLLGIGLVIQSQLLGNRTLWLAVAGGVVLFSLPAGMLGCWWWGKRPLTHLSRRTRFHSSLARTEADIITFCQRSPRGWWLAVGLTALSWVFLVLEYGLMVRYLGLPLTMWQIVTLLTAVRLAILLPLPGGLGSIEAAHVYALGLMGHSTAVGLSLSLVIRARDFVLGLLGLWTWRQLERQPDAESGSRNGR